MAKRIEYHSGAWHCPKCGTWVSVSRYKVGLHPRKCRRCKYEATIKIATVRRDRILFEKEIVSVPGRKAA